MPEKLLLRQKMEIRKKTHDQNLTAGHVDTGGGQKFFVGEKGRQEKLNNFGKASSLKISIFHRIALQTL